MVNVRGRPGVPSKASGPGRSGIPPQLSLRLLPEKLQEVGTGPPGFTSVVAIRAVPRAAERSACGAFGSVWLLILRHLGHAVPRFAWFAASRSHAPILVDRRPGCHRTTPSRHSGAGGPSGSERGPGER